MHALLDPKLTERLELLDAARTRARHEGRAPDWFEARPETQPQPGLTNQGATCFLNALLQQLYAIEEVRRAVYAFQYVAAVHGREHECVPLQLGRLFAQLQLSSLRTVSTHRLTAAFGWSRAEYVQQHDVQECCRALFDSLTASGVPVEERFFRGTLRSSLRCLRCGHRREHGEGFSDVPLGCAGITELERALAAFVTTERLDGDDAWHCEACAAKVPALKGMSFAVLPALLMLSLSRYELDAATGRRRKLGHRVAFPRQLDMSDYMQVRPPPEGGPVAASPSAPDSGQSLGAAAAAAAGAACLYDCIGALLHKGSAQGGHYTALLRESGAGAGRRWRLFDDSSVTEVSAEDWSAAAGAGAPSDTEADDGASAYCLVYRRAEGGAAAAPPSPPAWLEAEVAEEEAEAAELRAHAAAAACIVELRVVSAHDASRETSLTVHSDLPADFLLQVWKQLPSLCSPTTSLFPSPLSSHHSPPPFCSTPADSVRRAAASRRRSDRLVRWRRATSCGANTRFASPPRRLGHRARPADDAGGHKWCGWERRTDAARGRSGIFVHDAAA